jgi:hypothetical protein
MSPRRTDSANEAVRYDFPPTGCGRYRGYQRHSTGGGRELFYRNDDEMMAVEIGTQPNFSAGTPKTLFDAPYETLATSTPNYDVSADGQRFLMLKAVGQAQASTQINVVLNWFEELKRLVPARS